MCWHQKKKKKIRFLSQTGAFVRQQNPSMGSALGDSSGQEHSSSSAPMAPVWYEVQVSACRKLPCTWGIFGESFSSSRLPDPSLLHGAEARFPWRQHCHCWPGWAALLRPEDDISPENVCALCGSVLHKVGVSMSAQCLCVSVLTNRVCIDKTASWSWLCSEEIPSLFERASPDQPPFLLAQMPVCSS